MKKYLLLSFLLLNIGCAAITNTNKPELRDRKAIASASVNNVIESRSRYTYGNMALMLLFPIGTVAGLIGGFYDIDHNNNYVVTDPEGYEAWKIQYLELVKKRRDELLNPNLKNN